MSSPPPPEPSVVPAVPSLAVVADAPAVSSAEARIAFVFRTTQRQGRIHPLLHLMQQHRSAQAALKGQAP
ncbi:MAG TPA: hypothetical protein VEZ89_04895 [Rubrivivax sp.]|nr:hypothetical protein [Rubrivivax sp.]